MSELGAAARRRLRKLLLPVNANQGPLALVTPREGGSQPADSPAISAADEVDALCTPGGAHAASQALYRRYLRSFGWGWEDWLADLLAMVAPLFAAKRHMTRIAMLRALLQRCGPLPYLPHRLAAISAGLVGAKAKQEPGNPLPGESITLKVWARTPDGLNVQINVVQIKLRKPEVDSVVGITLSDGLDDGSCGGLYGPAYRLPPASENVGQLLADKPPPLISGLAAGCIAELSGEVHVGQRLVEVNGVPVHGHAHGTQLLTQLQGELVLRLSQPPRPTAPSRPLSCSLALLSAVRHTRLALKRYARDDPIAAEVHVRKAAGLARTVLTNRLATFRTSAEYECACRVRHVVPTPVDLRSFSLIRRIGRGSFGGTHHRRARGHAPPQPTPPPPEHKHTMHSL